MTAASKSWFPYIASSSGAVALPQEVALITYDASRGRARLGAISCATPDLMHANISILNSASKTNREGFLRAYEVFPFPLICAIVFSCSDLLQILVAAVLVIVAVAVAAVAADEVVRLFDAGHYVDPPPHSWGPVQCYYDPESMPITVPIQEKHQLQN